MPQKVVSTIFKPLSVQTTCHIHVSQLQVETTSCQWTLKMTIGYKLPNITKYRWQVWSDATPTLCTQVMLLKTNICPDKLSNFQVEGVQRCISSGRCINTSFMMISSKLGTWHYNINISAPTPTWHYLYQHSAWPWLTLAGAAILTLHLICVSDLQQNNDG